MSHVPLSPLSSTRERRVSAPIVGVPRFRLAFHRHVSLSVRWRCDGMSGPDGAVEAPDVTERGRNGDGHVSRARYLPRRAHRYLRG